MKKEIMVGFVCTIPPKEIHEDYNPGYVSAVGHPYLSVPMVVNMCQTYKTRYETDPEFKKLVDD